MTDEIDKFLVDQIKRHEGFRSKVYKCSAGKWTIGYGRNVEDVGITVTEAEYLLDKDLYKSQIELSSSLPWYKGLSHRRKQAMINLHFNMGTGTLSKFQKFLAAMSASDYSTASAELLNSKYAQQVGQRAQEIAGQIVNG